MIPRSLTDLSFRIRIPDVPTEAQLSRLRPVVAKLRQIAAATVNPLLPATVAITPLSTEVARAGVIDMRGDRYLLVRLED